ncbi:WbqC family protein [Granulosicoccus antarcticus]|uniref:WbqC-like protein family protein n=1 Tax=Granulosicoccus antarcticus IMCC3135 TaxID=1192854 RepID=A0A2Z2NTP3_9GAMM|nr:WbqC family protein [Granulosicoccus antarcticus]ASJ74922.1 hypothetical protein IMCC3135_24270 [Granulosicoccus antarcticus IMCC3135]
MSTIAIHQPQYLPWLPYFQKISDADHFVLLDNVQYDKRGLQNRNQIKGPNGPLWLTVPVHASIDRRISSVRVADQKWQEKHKRSIKQCYAKAAHIELYEKLLEPILSNEYEFLVDLNIAIIQIFLDFLEIRTNIIKASSLNAKGRKEELMINICKELNATRYLSGTGAREYQSDIQFKEQGIQLEYHVSEIPDYKQCHMKNGFEKGMSIVDMILNLGADTRPLL